MFLTLKNNLQSHWTNFSSKAARIYDIIFNTRDIEQVRIDYFEHKWISKEELARLLEHEEQQFVAAYGMLQAQYNDLLSSFSMNAMSNYSLLERKMQGTLKK